jgi:hypothetical protein
MKIDAFITTFEENKVFDVTFYHMPSRWQAIDLTDFAINPADWSEEIKFLAPNELDVSDEMKSLPENCGGIYIFFIKGMILPYFETYLAYIGRAQFTNAQNLKKRCNSYYYEFFKENRRPKIARMIEKWGNYLYLRYYRSIENDFIKRVEEKFINGILPPFNDEIPEITINEPEPAFPL